MEQEARFTFYGLTRRLFRRFILVVDFEQNTVFLKILNLLLSDRWDDLLNELMQCLNVEKIVNQ